VPLTATDPFVDWLRAARDGSQEDLGRVLDAFRGYLLMVAQSELGSTLRAKAGPSDLVQDSLIEAQAGFDQFRGASRDEFQAWLAQILRHNIADFARRFRETERREVTREQPLDRSPEAYRTAAPAPSPSDMAAATDVSAKLRAAMARLSDEHRQVLVWRQFEKLGWAEIGERVGKSADAARKAWFRAIERLKLELGPTDAPRSP
jgi:RNA polymerase sigma-70 factor (ECF subfamily)